MLNNILDSPVFIKNGIMKIVLAITEIQSMGNTNQFAYKRNKSI